MIRVTLGVDFMGKEWLDMMRSVGMIAVIRCHVWLLQSLDKAHSNAKVVTTQKQSQQAEDVLLF